MGPQVSARWMRRREFKRVQTERGLRVMRVGTLVYRVTFSAVVALTAAALPATAWASGYGSGPGLLANTPYSGFNSALVRRSAVLSWFLLLMGAMHDRHRPG